MRKLTNVTPQMLTAIAAAAINADEAGDEFWSGDADERASFSAGMKKAGEWAMQELVRRGAKKGREA